MKEPETTEIICILDRSGSMHGLESDTVGGYNSFIRKQGELEGRCLITTILFSDQYEVLHDRVPAEKAEIGKHEYEVRGMTALYDAVGKTILDCRDRLSKTGDHPDKVIMVIITDGYENASREYSGKMIRYMIREQKESHGWEFLFFGANIESERAGGKIGIARNCTHDFKATSLGVGEMISELSEIVMEKRTAYKR